MNKGLIHLYCGEGKGKTSARYRPCGPRGQEGGLRVC
jgi:hypothetical protein